MAGMYPSLPQYMEGWVTESQVALEEGLSNNNTKLEQKHMLMDILEGLPSRPDEWPNLFAKGYNQYAYSAKELKETRGTHRQGAIYQAQAEIHQGSEFASLTKQVGNQVAIKGNKFTQAFASTRDNQVVVLGGEAVG